MFKRRLAVLAAVATLAVTGLAGSALADEPARPTSGAKVICKTSDGKTIELAKALPAKGFKATRPDGEIRKAEPGETVVLRDGDPAAEVKALPRPEDEAERHTRVEDGYAVAAPALPAEGVLIRDHADAPKGVAKTIRISCEKAE
ncbi:hypothetical protein ABGB14_23180 [Nonomuraea sp. B10E15]|uniref:hypothetical protein n=1 Tax=Nonomuraea sp. B10E15 TaxID=3153560 RepID=UPI00325F773F